MGFKLKTKCQRNSKTRTKRHGGWFMAYESIDHGKLLSICFLQLHGKVWEELVLFSVEKARTLQCASDIT